MRIGLISDTHIPDHAKALPPHLKDVFKDVDLILHAGDMYALRVLDELEEIAPVLAALGDDDFSTVTSDRRVSSRHIIKKEGLTIWLVHQKPVRIPVVSQDKPWIGEPPDIIVYGHTHRADIENADGILKINPGSATFPEYRLEPGTVALLTIAAGKAEAEIIDLATED